MAKQKQYTNICSRVSGINCTQDRLNLIKDHFREKIDSPRRYDRISNLNQLLKILEKRDILNVENITPLLYIAEILQRNDIFLVNGFYEEPIQNHSFPRSGILPEVSSDPIENVFDIICRDIGHKWKQFARKLEIPEGYIDELERCHPRISESVREILYYHKQNSDDRYWKINLCRALKEARQSELSMKVEFLFAKHGLM